MNALELALILGSYRLGRDFLLTWFCIEALNPSEQSEKVCQLRSRGADRAVQAVTGYHKAGFTDRVLLIILSKKLGFLARATTPAEVSEILKPSIPLYRAGEFSPRGPYHVEEEELLFWSYVSDSVKLQSDAAQRAIELFLNYQEEKQERR